MIGLLCSLPSFIIISIMDKEPTQEQCDQAAVEAIKISRDELEARGISWDLLAKKLKEELEAKETHVFLGKVVGKIPDENRPGKFIRVEKTEVVYSKPMTNWVIRQKARISAHELSGHNPPKETRIAGPGGGPIPLQRLEVEFVKSSGVRKKKEE